MANFSRNKTAW